MPGKYANSKFRIALLMFLCGVTVWIVSGSIGQTTAPSASAREKQGLISLIFGHPKAAPGPGDVIGEPGPLFATGAALGKDFPHGALLVTDEEGSNYKAVAMHDLAAALKLSPGAAVAAMPAKRVAAVTATV